MSVSEVSLSIPAHTQKNTNFRKMEIFNLLSIVFLAGTVVAVYFWPEIIIGVQLFSTPIFGLALKSLGLGIGSVNTIFALTAFSLLLYARRNKGVQLLPCTFIEFALMGLILWGAATLTYTPSPNYGTSKVLFLIFISLPCLYIARVYCSDLSKVKTVFTAVGWYSIACVIFYAAYVAFNATGSSRIRSSFFSPLTLGYITVGVMPFIYAVFSSSKTIGKLFSGSSILAAIYVLIATGSRGPALALVTAILLSLVRGRNFIKVVFGIAATGGIAYFLASKYAASGLDRILGETKGGSNSSESRMVQFQMAIDQFLQFPLFGQGIGSYSHFFHSIDTKYYPHNSFLEIAGELGLLGLLIYLSALLFCFFRIIGMRQIKSHINNDYFWIIASIQALFFAGLINSCLSNAFTSQRMLFVSFGLLAASTKWKER